MCGTCLDPDSNQLTVKINKIGNHWTNLNMDWVLYDNKNAFDSFISCDNGLGVIQENVHIFKGMNTKHVNGIK